MKRKLLFLFIALISFVGIQAQTTIVSQSFEGTGTWAYVPTPAAFDVSGDVWDIKDGTWQSVNLATMPSEGTLFWGVSDLANGNGGTVTGEWGKITFAPVDVSANSNVTINFDYDIYGFDDGDDVAYAIYEDGVLADSALMIDGFSNYSETGTKELAVNDVANSVVFILYVKQNGGDYAGFDNFKVVENVPFTNDNNSYVDATGVTQPAASNISSLLDTEAEAVPVFQFNIADAGTADGLPTEVTAITIKAGVNNTADWTNDIGGGYLYKEGVGALTITTPPTVLTDQVTFYIDDTELDIADGGSQLVTLYTWIDSTVTDNLIIECMVDADAHGFVADPAGSIFAADFGTDVIGNQHTINVVATELYYVQQPTNVEVNATMAPTVQVAATDANYNIDEDYTSAITLSFSGTGTMGGTNPVSATYGVSMFPDLTFDTEETGVSLTANDGAITGVTSETFDVTAVFIAPDVFISEYIEGSSSNKAVEIYNNTGGDIDLSQYSVKLGPNGGGWGTTEVLSGTLANGDVFVVANPGAGAEIIAVADVTSTVCYFNGDDAIGLFYNDVLIDVVGDPNNDPGTGWDVAGTTTGTLNHTIVRKHPDITTGNTDWTASAGTNTTDSEWTVYTIDEFSYIGSHGVAPIVPTQLAITSVSPASPVIGATFEITVEAQDGTNAAGNVDQDTEVQINLANGTGTITGTVTGTITNGTSSVTITGLSYDVAETIDVNASVNTGMALTTSANQSIIVNNVPTASIPYLEPFDADLGDMTVVSVSGDSKTWYYNSTGQNASVNGYNSGDIEEDWLIFPAIDFDAYSNEVLTFESEYQYGNDDIDNYLVLMYSADYVGYGNPSGATWTELSFTKPSAASTWTASGDIDLSAITGTDVHIAFKYHYNPGSYRRWSIDNIVLTEKITPTQLTITEVSPASPYVGADFEITVQAQDGSGLAGNVDQDTEVQINLANGTGIISGTLTGTIANGASSVTISGLSYDVAEAIEVNASVNTGMGLTTSANQSITVNNLPTASIPYLEPFDADLGDMTVVSVSGDTKTWYHYATGQNASINGYNSGDIEEDWMIFPSIDFDAYSNEILTFESEYQYGNDDVDNYLALMYSTDYAGHGSPSGATWTELSFTKPSAASTWTASGDVDLSAITGTDVHIAFKYHYNPGSYRRWSIDNISITESAIITPTQLAITSVSPASPVVGTNFDITVEAQDGTNTVGNVDQDTEVQINLANGTGTITGTVTGTITNGTSSVTITGLSYDVAETIEVNASVNTGMTLATSANESIIISDVPDQDLFFSEYIEGSSNNKALEIYNPTSSTVSLDDYVMRGTSNEANDWEYLYIFPTGAEIAPNETFVIADNDADPILVNAADWVATGFEVSYNGNDSRGLFKISGTDTVLIDLLGNPNNPGGNNYDVAGVTGAMAEHTLVRKSSITQGNTNWAASAGTNATDSEWEVYDQDDFTFIGWHINPPAGIQITNVLIDPANPTVDDPVTVSADIEDVVKSITTAKVFWGLTSGALDNEITMSLGTGTTWTADNAIPAQSTAGTEVFYMVWAENDGGEKDSTNEMSYVVSPSGPISIYDIQYTTDPSGDSPYNGMSVTTTGIVTAVRSNNNFYIQDGEGAWNGILVYQATETVAIGDSIVITAEVAEYNGLTELTNVSDITIVSSGNTLPNPAVILTGDMDELYEGVLIRVEDAIANYISGGDTWSVYNGSIADSLVAYNGEFEVTYTPEINHHYNITGIGKWYSYGSIYEILPRENSDIEDVTTGTEPVIENIVINPANPTENDVVSVTADVTDDGTVEEVSLYWGTDAASITNEITMSVQSGSTYVTDTDIPAQAAGTTVYYYVEAIDDEGLVAESATADYTTTVGISELNSSIAAMYPNPANAEVTIELATKADYIINIYSVVGELVYTNEFNAAEKIVNLNNIQNGVYQVQVINVNTKQSSISKLVVK